MTTYRLTPSRTTIERVDDGTFFPIDVSVAAYQRFLADGGVASPAPLVYSADQPISGRVTTVGAAPGELFRFPLLAMTGYDVVVRLIGVDTGNGAIKKLVADLTVKRLGAGPLQVGATTVTVTHNDAAASTWTVAASFSGNDGIISAVGAAGRTVDWSMRGAVTSFTPAGV